VIETLYIFVEINMINVYLFLKIIIIKKILLFMQIVVYITIL